MGNPFNYVTKSWAPGIRDSGALDLPQPLVLASPAILVLFQLFSWPFQYDFWQLLYSSITPGEEKSSFFQLHLENTWEGPGWPLLYMPILKTNHCAHIWMLLMIILTKADIIKHI